VNAIEQVWILPAAPLWAFIVILLDVIILYNSPLGGRNRSDGAAPLIPHL
jgi:hypothetical protein